MADQSEAQRLRDFLQGVELSPEERRQSDVLLKQATQGDYASLTRVEQLALERGYEPIAGTNVPLSPGPLMVCPVDPAHYRACQRDIGEELVCPEHDVPLVLAQENE